MLRSSAASYAFAWRHHFARTHEPIRILGERNLFRYRPCRGVLVRGDASSPAGRIALGQVLLAARTCGVPVTVSLSRGRLWPWLLAALVGVLLHSVVDFDLQIPAVSVLFVVLAGTATGGRVLRREDPVPVPSDAAA